jgi:hypothetical protein
MPNVDQDGNQEPPFDTRLEAEKEHPKECKLNWGEEGYKSCTCEFNKMVEKGDYFYCTDCPETHMDQEAAVIHEQQLGHRVMRKKEEPLLPFSLEKVPTRYLRMVLENLKALSSGGYGGMKHDRAKTNAQKELVFDELRRREDN